MMTGADRSAFPNGSTFGKLIDGRRWSLVVIPLNVLPPFAARESMIYSSAILYTAVTRILASHKMKTHRSFPGRWHRPAIFLAPSIEGDTIVIFFFRGPDRFRRANATQQST